jgi:hypothetical protein
VQFSYAFNGEVYEFYSVSPEYFGYTLVRLISIMHFLVLILYSYDFFLFSLALQPSAGYGVLVHEVS